MIGKLLLLLSPKLLLPGINTGLVSLRAHVLYFVNWALVSSHSRHTYMTVFIFICFNEKNLAGNFFSSKLQLAVKFMTCKIFPT